MHFSESVPVLPVLFIAHDARVCACVRALETSPTRRPLTDFGCCVTEKKTAIELAHFINDTDPFMQRILLFKRGLDYLLRLNKDMQKDLRRYTSTIFPFSKQYRSKTPSY